MNPLRKYLILIILSATSLSYATSVSGYVSNAKELTLYYVSNFLTGEKTTVAQCTVSPQGHYHFEFESTELRTYYVNLGSLQAQIVMAPEQNLTLDLPDYTPLRKAEYLNPYYETGNILVYDNTKQDINYHLMKIERCTARQLKRVLESQNPSFTAALAIDSIKALNALYTHPYLKDYNRYSQALFYQMAHPENTQAIKQQYLRSTTPNLQNSAFTNLFSAEYYNPFLASDGLFYQSVTDAIITGELTKNFSNAIGSLYKINNPTMAELITVKGFYDAALYAPTYQKTLTQLMRQLENELQDSCIRTLCRSSRLKIERLMVGNPAPYYELFTLKGKKVPTVLKRRNVLLAFINTNIFECQKQLRLLEKYKDSYKRQLEVVVIAVYQDKDELERFLKRNTFENLYFTLWDNNDELLEDYNIKALPAYFLIGKDGNIIYAPLSSPEETMLEELQQELGI